MEQEAAFLTEHFSAISSFLSAQDGISELPNIFFFLIFFYEEASSRSDKFLGTP